MAQYKGAIMFQLVMVVFMGAALLGAMASDPDPLLDFCVSTGDLYSSCKLKEIVTSNDFIYKGTASPGDPTKDPSGFVQTPAQVTQFRALHTLGISIVRLSYAKGGLVNIHTHPHASEMVYVISGKLYVGFVGSDNKLYDGYLEAGYTTVIPRGLVHFSMAVGDDPVYAIAAFNSENPLTQIIPNALFGKSNIPDAVLSKGIGINVATVQSIKDQFRKTYGNDA
ncbi:hypothetical protein M758_6G037300 [Ceratodon purpureus]|uniref:Germin-like protein n=1 Tax=Ceratodon purpureus TaxID=3225 RepID=A0A8T0HF19_CERPU|nr:hypothetical protein KC19_6G040200 [Ceratodon purpureus]KAG0612558.1 hypothetical protein M758_6G037300 [Ceratodon purpureus]